MRCFYQWASISFTNLGCCSARVLDRVRSELHVTQFLMCDRAVGIATISETVGG